MDLTATSTSELLKLNRETINNYFTEFRELILENSIQQEQKELGIFELDESYFGAKRVKILEGSTIHTDGRKAYDGLILNGYTHYRIYHHENKFVRGKSRVNGIESFWSFAKRLLAKFNGLTQTKSLSCT